MTRTAIHPGEFLADELAELGMNAAELARELNVPPNRVYQLIAGKRALTADTALRLSQWFGTSPELWMNLQARYDLLLAEQKAGEHIRRTIKRRSAGSGASAAASAENKQRTSRITRSSVV